MFPDLLPFGIAVTLETGDTEIPVYEEVAEQLAVRPVVRPRVPVDVGNI